MVDGIYLTTDDSAFVQHQVECIECTGETSERVTSANEAYRCDECGVKVVDDMGEIAVSGEVSERTIEAFSLRKEL